jgi:hypothetical protein
VIERESLQDAQRNVCLRYAARFDPVDLTSTLGFSKATVGKLPINGLRHPPEGRTNGWYIWFGEELRTDADFFVPLHAYHLDEACPEVLKFLALPAGYRFLVAPNHEDVWYDPALLNI